MKRAAGLWGLGLLASALGVQAGFNLGTTGAAKSRARNLAEKINAGPSVESRINTPGWADSPFISRDGQRLYFMYSRWDFGPFFLGGAPVLRGPDRPGHHNDDVNPWDDSDIYVATKRGDGSWGAPVNMGFNSAGGDASGMELSSGTFFVWIKPTLPSGQPDIYISTRDAFGNWSAPVGISTNINTVNLEDNPHLWPDGNSLWFTSDRGGGAGGKDIWFSSKTAGVWNPPVNAGPTLNRAADEDQFWVSPVNFEVYFTRNNQIYRSSFTGLGYTAPTLVNLGLAVAAEPSITDDGQDLYVATGDTTTAHIRIMHARFLGGGNWATPVPVD